MTSTELDFYFKELLSIEAFSSADPSQNGLQVDNSGKEIKTIAFTVDACLETINQAQERGADMLFVHHGIFWGESLTLKGPHYKRIKALLDSDMARYAVHLPLDAHPLYGNNAGLAKRLNLTDIKKFGTWRGLEIGLYGTIPINHASQKGASLDEVAQRLFPDGEKPLHLLPFGKKEIESVGIISGGAADEVKEAIALNLDLYITGEIEHETYHRALENKINVIAGGHYQTETVGVSLVAKKLAQDTNIATFFIDVPTGL